MKTITLVFVLALLVFAPSALAATTTEHELDRSTPRHGALQLRRRHRDERERRALRAAELEHARAERRRGRSAFVLAVRGAAALHPPRRRCDRRSRDQRGLGLR